MRFASNLARQIRGESETIDPVVRAFISRLTLAPLAKRLDVTVDYLLALPEDTVCVWQYLETVISKAENPNADQPQN